MQLPPWNCTKIPKIDECTDALGDARVFSSLDANRGYYQIKIDERDQRKTAFIYIVPCTGLMAIKMA